MKLRFNISRRFACKLGAINVRHELEWPRGNTWSVLGVLFQNEISLKHSLSFILHDLCRKLKFPRRHNKATVGLWQLWCGGGCGMVAVLV